MKTTTSEYNEKTPIFTSLNEKANDDKLSVSDLKESIEGCKKKSNDSICPILTLTDIIQALNTIEIRQNLSRKRTNSSDSDISPMSPEQKTQSTIEYNCCRLVHPDKSSRLLLPLARRGRPHVSSRSPRLLCKNCFKIKQKQQNDILQKQNKNYHDDETNSINIFDTITDLDKTIEQENQHQMMIQDIPHEIEFSLMNDNEKNDANNSEYESAQMLVWKINTSDNHNQTNTIDAAYDTGSLTNNEKKNLLQEAIQKLQIVLGNRSSSTTTTIPDIDLDKIEFTYRALQTTVNILSSSLDSL
ncbi:unnamed protein product [Rotaria sp. Silwood2]|nr:unnamed protein product [Rotaria sp. Silwood2]CAF2510997.1 unnamed protein product [Rotaria sp. Silwood2]CAF2717980.1 unnamed protein product [Rotaria sp. Silwood2]CAF2869986.1 unnamed protein product [Rotaria sp. Silwood2]CAF3939632.1 unnamed protein product [Rotaria sp. Silwood2]